MTGLEQFVVWLFGILCAAITACSVAKSWAQGLVDVAKQHGEAHVQAHRMVVEAKHGPLTVPPEWSTRDGEQQ